MDEESKEELKDELEEELKEEVKEEEKEESQGLEGSESSPKLDSWEEFDYDECELDE